MRQATDVVYTLYSIQPCLLSIVHCHKMCGQVDLYLLYLEIQIINDSRLAPFIKFGLCFCGNCSGTTGPNIFGSFSAAQSLESPFSFVFVSWQIATITGNLSVQDSFSFNMPPSANKFFDIEIPVFRYWILTKATQKPKLQCSGSSPAPFVLKDREF